MPDTRIVFTKYTQSTHYTHLLLVLSRSCSFIYVHIHVYVHHDFTWILTSYSWETRQFRNCLPRDPLIHRLVPFRVSHSSPPPAPSLSLIPSFRFTRLQRFYNGPLNPTVSHPWGRRFNFPVSRLELDCIRRRLLSIMTVVCKECLLYLFLFLFEVPPGDKNHGQESSSSILESLGFWNQVT